MLSFPQIVTNYNGITDVQILTIFTFFFFGFVLLYMANTGYRAHQGQAKTLFMVLMILLFTAIGLGLFVGILYAIWQGIEQLYYASWIVCAYDAFWILVSLFAIPEIHNWGKNHQLHA